MSPFIAWYVSQLWKVFEEKKLRLQRNKRHRVWKSRNGLKVKKKKDLKKKGKGGKPNASVPLIEDDVKLLHDKELLGKSTPDALLIHFGSLTQSISGFVVVRNIAICVGGWGGGGVKLRQATNGEEFLEYSKRQTKTRTVENPRDIGKLNRKCLRFQKVWELSLYTNYTRRKDHPKCTTTTRHFT